MNGLLTTDDVRIQTVLRGFERTFGGRAEALFCAPGRTEIVGNHTDHQRGCVVAASINLDTLAAVRPNGSGVIRVKSDGHDMNRVPLDDLEAKAEERGRSTALVRGVASRFTQLGHIIGGFDAYTVSDVPKGSGLSSSAAFEVLLGTIISRLFCGGSVDAAAAAKIGQYAENVYFGKPSGLMDQMACAVGGLVFMDFKNESEPEIERIGCDFSKSGYALCIIDSGAQHSDLTDQYAAITEDLKAVCALFGRRVLREIPQDEFMSRIPDVRAAAGDRAVLRALHVYEENKRAVAARDALKDGDFERFLGTLRESGRSSFMYLQNVVQSGAAARQELALALALCDAFLKERGSFRVHGGGFAGTVQAFVPLEAAKVFKRYIEGVFGENRCRILSLRLVGATEIPCAP